MNTPAEAWDFDHQDVRRGQEVRRFMRHNNDTKTIAQHWGCTEAAVWNALARAERIQPNSLKRQA